MRREQQQDTESASVKTSLHGMHLIESDARSEPSSSLQLFTPETISDLVSRWRWIQAGFVDEPRVSVSQASELVGQAVHALTSTFERERQMLEERWSRGEQVSTEELRVVLQRYRAFFQCLLSL